MRDYPGVEPRAGLPNLIVIGVSKAGTTSLFEYLGQHPAVGLSDLKELRYFTPLRYGEPIEPLESYARHFAACQEKPYAVEATPGYFYGGLPTARAMHEICPSLKTVLSLRDPTDRCWSWFRFVKSRLRIPKALTFEDYVDRCEQLRREGTDGALDNQPYWGLGGGCYSNWLGAWADVFQDDLKIVFFDDLVDDTQNLMQELFGWLDLDPEEAGGVALATTNKTVQYRNRAVQRLAVSLNRRGERYFRRHPRLKRVVRGGYYRLNEAPPEPRMSAAMRDRLHAFYEPYNARLAAEVAGRGLKLPDRWGAASADALDPQDRKAS